MAKAALIFDPGDLFGDTLFPQVHGPAGGNRLRPGRPRLPLFFLADQFHGLATAHQYSFSSHQHFYFIPADFAHIDLANFVGH